MPDTTVPYLAPTLDRLTRLDRFAAMSGGVRAAALAVAAIYERDTRTGHGAEPIDHRRVADLMGWTNRLARTSLDAATHAGLIGRIDVDRPDRYGYAPLEAIRWTDG